MTIETRDRDQIAIGAVGASAAGFGHLISSAVGVGILTSLYRSVFRVGVT